MTYNKAEEILKQKTFNIFFIIGIIYCTITIIPGIVFIILWVNSTKKNKDYIKAKINIIGKIAVMLHIIILVLIIVAIMILIIKITILQIIRIIK